jgi:CheY-like chemotaxis protein
MFSRALLTDPQTILLVDDDPDSSEPLSALLEMQKYRVLRAADGLEALAYLESEPSIALVILDGRMPNMDGPTLLGRIRHHSRLSQLPVILVSAYPQVNPEEVQAIFIKPVDFEWLLAAVDRNMSADNGKAIPPDLFSQKNRESCILRSSFAQPWVLLSRLLSRGCT